MGNFLYNLVFIFFPSILITWLFIDLPTDIISLKNICYFIISFMLSYLISFLLSYFIACLSIWIVNIWRILDLYYVLLLLCVGTLLTLSIYREIVQKFLI